MRRIRINGNTGNLRVLVAASSGRGEINTYKIAPRTTPSTTSLARRLTANSLMPERKFRHPDFHALGTEHVNLWRTVASHVKKRFFRPDIALLIDNIST